ncbi:uncharacterized protein LOC135844958 isoform X10 [Planococcus citri]|uniref:uncharacterized protein LOC135844958 isoform X10 n=1 Tax=Planococcus citri TaxID=170843 RepID=UPI0031F8C888
MDDASEIELPTENPFSFLQQESSLSLQMLATSKYALFLWRNMYYAETRYNRPAWFSFRKVMSESFRDINKVPPLLKAFIDDRILRIGEEISMWEVNFRAAVLDKTVPNNWKEDLSKKFEDLFAATTQPAINKAVDLLGVDYLMSSIVLDEKHVDILVKGFDNIACNPNGSICFQSSAKNLLMKEDLDPVMRFRIAGTFCLENQIRDIWPSVNTIIDKIFGSDKPPLMLYWKNILTDFVVPEPFLARLLLNLADDGNWAAFEYLLDKASEETRTTTSVAVIQKYDFYSMKRVLLKLEENQLRNIYPLVGDRIFSNIVTHAEYFEYAIETWVCMKNHIPGEMFAKIVHQLWQLVFNPSELELTRVTQNRSILLEVWTSANDSLKSNVSEAELFAKLDYTVELSEWLRFFVQNPRRLEELSEEIIMSNLDRIASCDENELTKCHQFIRNTFRDAEKGDKFIKQMISRPECLGWIYYKLDECCFDKVENLCNRFPPSKIILEEMKQEFLVYCHRNFARGQICGFDGKKFIEFVSWCSPREEKLRISEFRDSLCIDDIFDVILNKFVLEASKNPPGPTQQILSSFDNFLQCYFGSSEAAKQYKSIKLMNYDEWEGVKEVLTNAVPHCVQAFLYWGFEKDQDLVENVKLRLSLES